MVVIMTELHEAASVGDFVRVEEALKRALDPNETDPEWDDRTPLHIAASKGLISSRFPSCVCKFCFGVGWPGSRSVCMCCCKLEPVPMLPLQLAGHLLTLPAKLDRSVNNQTSHYYPAHLLQL